MAEVVSFCFNGYENNPIVKMCLAKCPRRTLTEQDLIPIIQKLKHSKWCWDNQYWSFVGDELRLYLAAHSDDFIYIDADVVINNPEDIKMDCCPPDKNNGSFFRANKNTTWVKYYLDIYESKDIGRQTNCEVFSRYPFEIPTQQGIDYVHYYTSFWERWKHRNPKVKHTMLYDIDPKEHEPYAKVKSAGWEWHTYKELKALNLE